jgi:methionine biosynthesis protein MetW
MDSHESFVREKFIQVSKLIPEGSKILDIGCNDGKMKDFLKNPVYCGVDIDKKFISELIKKGIKAKKADLNKKELPFKNERFDFILLLDVLEHVVNPQKLLLEAKKRLKEDGKIIVSLPNDYHVLNKARFLLNRHLTEDPFASYGHLHYFPIKSGEKFLINNGFEILATDYLIPIKPRLIPQSIKKILAHISPQAFVRDVLYVLKSKD